MFWIILIVIISHTFTHSVFYDIPSYYGHFGYNYFEPQELLNAKLVLLEYHFALDATYDNLTVYFAQEKQHCIYQYSNLTGQIKKFAGNCGTSGNIVGSILSAEFNGVSSVAYFQTPSESLLKRIKNQKIYLTINSSCSIEDTSCIVDVQKQILNNPPPNYPPQNKDFSPNNTNIQSISTQNIRIFSQVSLYEYQQGQPQYLYVADTNNHCIKKIQLATLHIDIVAGICGIQGFMDGPQEYNRLSFPRNLGVSRQGVIYFFDSGNEYIRILNIDGNVQTLLLGACKQYRTGRRLLDYQLKQILCYQSWIEGQTQSSINHYFDPSILNICTQHSSKCFSQ